MKIATVLMPVYNCAPFLREAIDSVLEQNFTDFNFLIINDGSTDDSEKIILSYNDNRIAYIKNEKNIGLVNTLNKGIDLIDTRYIIRMDGDDISMPGRFKRLVEEMDTHPEMGVISSYLKLFGDKTQTWKMPLNDREIKAGLIFNSTIAHAPCIIRTEVLKRHNIRYSNNFPHMEDWDLWFRLMKHTTFLGIPEVLYRYRIFGNNITIVNYATLAERRKKFYIKMFDSLGWGADENEINLHLGFGEVSVMNPTIAHLREYKKWFKKIRSLNFEYKAFPVNELNDILNSKERVLFFHAADFGIYSGIAYWFIFGHFQLKHPKYLLAALFKRKKT